MRSMALLTIRSTFFALLLAAASDLLACSCPSWTIQENIDAAQVVVRARLTEARLLPRLYKVEMTFAVSQVFKGDVRPGVMKVRTAESEAVCGVAVVVPREYVLFIDRNGEVSWCSGTFRLTKGDRFEPRLQEFLRVVKKGNPSTAPHR